MTLDDFEMENQGYEEEFSMHQNRRINSKYLDENEKIDKSRFLINDRANNEQKIVNPFRNDSENHVYEDIAVSVNSNDLNKSINNRDFQISENPRWLTCDNKEDNKNIRISTPLSSLEMENNNSHNFHRNLTLPVRRTIVGSSPSDDSATRCSVRVTNRERTRFSNNQKNIDSSIYDRSNEISGSNDDHHHHNHYHHSDNVEENGATKEANQTVEKTGRRRRKKDCKHCKNRFNMTTTGNRASNMPTLKIQKETTERIKDSASTLDLSVYSLSDRKLPLNNAQASNLHSKLSPDVDASRNTIFSISNNVTSVLNGNVTENFYYDKNETDLRLVSVELSDDRALITPPKNRTGMKVNSIYSQEQWRTKDVPIFVTEVKDQHFQRAYSLPTRTQTPSSQNRVNLRRSVRGEPPPNPARLRKNRHGWTLDFARPLDATRCTRSIVLLLIAIFALLGIGAIALYIVFEPEKLQVIQQYLRSSTPNSTSEINNTFNFDSLDFETNIKITTLPVTSITFTDNFGILAQETTLSIEPETDLVTTSTEITTDRNITRHCDDCYEGEVCVALFDEEVPICRIGPDPSDPTGCNGLCLINKQKCHRLDLDAFRCVEVEHYCLDDEWTCSNTLCIPLVKHCDGHMNCYDHSDEYDCVCDLQTHFQCGNETSCLLLEKRCDGKIDCWDASDEINCTLGQDFGWSCPSNSEFTCSNGECILKARFCDGLKDCTDGSDEPHGCQGRCNKQEFSCVNGRCITKGMKCNGIDDCGDNSDEQHCRDRVSVKPNT